VEGCVGWSGRRRRGEGRMLEEEEEEEEEQEAPRIDDRRIEGKLRRGSCVLWRRWASAS